MTKSALINVETYRYDPYPTGNSTPHLYRFEGLSGTDI